VSYYRVQEAVAGGTMMRFKWIPGPDKPADILSKHNGATNRLATKYMLYFSCQIVMPLPDDEVDEQ
jgi:hypothetical protein